MKAATLRAAVCRRVCRLKVLFRPRRDYTQHCLRSCCICSNTTAALSKGCHVSKHNPNSTHTRELIDVGLPAAPSVVKLIGHCKVMQKYSRTELLTWARWCVG